MVNYDDLVGVPYVSGGRDPKKGLDCWGLAAELYRRQGIQLPTFLVDTSDTALCASLFNANRPDWEELPEPVPGCLILLKFIRNPLPSHCGVYLGYGEFIHAEGAAVQIDRLRRWGPRVIGYFRPRKGVYPRV